MKTAHTPLPKLCSCEVKRNTITETVLSVIFTAILFCEIILHINFVDGLQRLHGSFKIIEGSSEGQKEDQPRGENAIDFGVRLALHRLKKNLSTSSFTGKSSF